MAIRCLKDTGEVVCTFFVTHVSVLGHVFLCQSPKCSQCNERKKVESFWLLLWNKLILDSIPSFCALCRSSACEAVQAGGVITVFICCGVFRLHTARITALAGASGRKGIILALYCNKLVNLLNLMWL